MNYLSDKAYLAIGKQTDAVTPVTPSVFVPLIEEDMKIDPKNERVKQIVGIDWASNKMLQGQREVGGSVTIQADPDSLGYFLDMLYKKGSTSGSGSVGYTHPFTVDSANYYTIELLRGNAVHRYVGCQITKMEMSFKDGHMQIKSDIVGRGSFTVATLKTALTGAGMTSVELDEEFDPEPANGLVAGDVIMVQEDDGSFTDVTIATVASDKKSITMSSTTVTASAGALIQLKEQTPSYSALQRPFRFGQMLVGFGADQSAADANVASYALATPVDELKLTLDRNISRRHASGKNDALTLVGNGDGELTVKKLFEDGATQQQWLDIAKKACTILITGDNIATTYYASLTIQLHNIKPSANDNKLSKGEYVYDETTFMVEYDDSDAAAVDISLVNKTASI